MPSSKPILLVDDDIVDRMTVQRSLRKDHIANCVVTANNGKEALDYLTGMGNERPLLIISDINMPEIDGFELLEAIRAHSDLKEIPVIVMAVSEEDLQRLGSLEHGILEVMKKPFEAESFREIVNRLGIEFEQFEP